jgi:hypothetical protein
MSTPGSFAYYDLDSSSWRTCQPSALSFLTTGWEGYSETWPRAGTTRSGTASRRPPSVLLTFAIESSYSDGDGNWPTPTVQDGKNDAGPSQFRRNYLALNVMAALYPEGSARTSPLPPEAQGGESGSSDTPLLNPEFVETLMGFEEEWTRIEGDG